MNADLDALATRLYVTIDDLLKDHPQWRPERPTVGIVAQLTDAELITLSVIQALLGYSSERRFIRYAHTHLRPWFAFLPQRAAYNKRLRAAGNMIQHGHHRPGPRLPELHRRPLGRRLHTRRARPLPRDRETIRPGRLRQLRLLRFAFPPVPGAATPPDRDTIRAPGRVRVDQRKDRRTGTALAMLDLDPILADRPGQVLIADKGYRSASFEAELNAVGITLIRPSLKSEKTIRPGQRLLKPFRQIIESVNQTFKAQLDLERHGGRKPAGVCARVLQRILALTATIWHNETSHRPGPARSLIAYDH